MQHIRIINVIKSIKFNNCRKNYESSSGCVCEIDVTGRFNIFVELSEKRVGHDIKDLWHNVRETAKIVFP